MSRVTVTDIQKAGFCVRGARRWFNDNGWSDRQFRDFLKNGMPEEEFLANGDYLARLVVDRKHEWENNDGR